MSGLAVRNKSGEKIYYTGSQFESMENVGTRHLCVRTGSGANDVVKYALTDQPLNDKYKVLRMRISSGAGSEAGRDAYIAQRYTTSVSESASGTYTTTRVSNYVSSTTLITASSSKLQTGNATRASTSATIYNGSLINNGGTFTTTVGDRQTRYSRTSYNSVISWLLTGNAQYMTASTGTRALQPNNYDDEIYAQVTHTDYSVTCRCRDLYRVTNTSYATRVSNYVTSTTLRTNSSSKLQTGNATRASTYNTSSGTSTTKPAITHNANL